MPCSFRIISEILPKIHTMEKCNFLKTIFHFLIISFSVIYPNDTNNKLKLPNVKVIMTTYELQLSVINRITIADTATTSVQTNTPTHPVQLSLSSCIT